MGLCSLQVLAQDSVLQSMSLSHSLSRRHPSLEMQTFCPAPQPSPCSSGWPDLILGAEASSPLNAFSLSPPAHTLRPPPCSFLWLSRLDYNMYLHHICATLSHHALSACIMQHALLAMHDACTNLEHGPHWIIS